MFQACLYLLKRYKQDIINDANKIELDIENSKPILELNELINILDDYILNIINQKERDDG